MQTLPKMSIYRHEWSSTSRRAKAAPKAEQIPGGPEIDPVPEEPVQTAQGDAGRRWLPVIVSVCVSLAVSGAVMWVGMQHYAEQQKQALAIAEHEQYRESVHRQAEEPADPGLRTSVDDNRTAIGLLTWPTAKSAMGQGTSNRPQARARVFVDESHGKCAIYASGLAEMPPGRTYEMWVTNGQGTRLPVGTFEASRDGNGSYIADLPIAADHVTEVAVSLEPLQGSPQPTSDVLIRASLR